MVRFASLFNVKDQTVMFLSRTTYSLQELGAMGMGDLLNAMFDFSEKLNSLALTEEELGLFTAVVLVSAGRSSSCLSLTPGGGWGGGGGRSSIQHTFYGVPTLCQALHRALGIQT